MMENSPSPAPVTRASVWSVRRLGPCHYLATFCCKQRLRGSFEVLAAPWLWQDFGLPESSEHDLVLCATGVVLDGFLPAGVTIPPVLDLEILAYADPEFIPTLHQRLAWTGRSVR
jgi:hypothetical protein